MVGSGSVGFSDAGNGQVAIRNLGCSQVLWGMVTHLAIQAGATFEKGHLVVDAFGFREMLRPLALLLRQRPGISVSYDDFALEHIKAHAEETQALRKIRETLDEIPSVTERLSANPMWQTPEPLTPEQCRNLAWLLACKHGADFSVPGAGKTRTALALHALLRIDRTVTQLLVVGPKNCFMAWETEASLCLPEFTVRRLTGGRLAVGQALRENPDIALVTYQMLVNVLDIVMAWMRSTRVHVVLDESHRIKGGRGRVTADVALNLAPFAARRDILSGTPAPHSLTDLEPQVAFLWPGQDALSYSGYNEPTPESVRKSLRRLYVRTRKSELDLPKLRVRYSLVELGPLQREIYSALKQHARSSLLARHDRQYFRNLGHCVIRLIQAASNPALLSGRDFDFGLDPLPIPRGSYLWELCQEYARFERPAKISAAINRARLNAREGKKTLIWSSFVANVEELSSCLAELGAVFLHGQIPTSETGEPDSREARIKQFREDPDCMVMIANPAAAAESISLHQVCHHSVYVDRTFNAAHYLQSIDRIHRLGLAADVVTEIEVLHAPQTIDHHINASLERKVQTMASVLDDEDLLTLAYDPADVVEDIPGGLDKTDVQAILAHLEQQ